MCLQVRKQINEFKVGAPARVGLVAPNDVTIPAGNTGMDPSQTSFFQVGPLARRLHRPPTCGSSAMPACLWIVSSARPPARPLLSQQQRPPARPLARMRASLSPPASAAAVLCLPATVLC